MHSLRSRLPSLVASVAPNARPSLILIRPQKRLFPTRPISLDRPTNQRSVTTSLQANRTIATSSTAYQAKRVEKFILHDIGEGIKEVIIRSWMVKVGDRVREFDAICEVESDKATAEITSRFNGKIKRIYHEVGATAAVGQPLVDIELELNPAESIDSSTGQTSADPERQSGHGELASKQASSIKHEPSSDLATLPSVRRLAADHQVDLTRVNATGKRGRILKEDVLAYISQSESSQVFAQSAVAPKEDGDGQSQEVVSLTSIQRAMHKTMSKSLEIPHFNYADEIDMTLLLDMVRRQKQAASKAGATSEVASSFAHLIKMVSMALLEYPQLNASLSEDGKSLVVKHFHNIGVAVDTRHGLVVPNIKNVQSLTIGQINRELSRVRELAYNSKLTTSDLSGATMSLSNIGAIGGTFGVPLIVSPEILIGALGQARRLPRFVSDTQVEARQVMQLVWSADHRVVDGATLSRFTNLLKQFIEQPENALLRMK